MTTVQQILSPNTEFIHFSAFAKMIILEKNKAIVVFSSENQNLKRQHEKGKTKAT